jgi:ketosteroid isomerase-like protein
MIDSHPMRPRWIRIAVLAAACGMLIIGCGDGSGSDQQSAKDAAQAYVDAYNAHDYGRVCDLLSDGYKQQLKASSCPAYLQEQSSGAATTLTLVDVQENGKAATVHVRSESEDTPGGQADQTLALQQQPDGSWQVSDVTSYSAG